MEYTSVLIVATLFIFLNAGFLASAEQLRDPAKDNIVWIIIIRTVCISGSVIGLVTMIGALRRVSCCLLPFLITIVLFFVGIFGLAGYLIAWCPFDKSNGENFLCKIPIVFGCVCMAGFFLASCLYYVVYSYYKFLRNGGIDEDDYLNNITEIELMERTHKEMLDYDPYYDPDQPSTSYN